MLGATGESLGELESSYSFGDRRYRPISPSVPAGSARIVERVGRIYLRFTSSASRGILGPIPRNIPGNAPTRVINRGRGNRDFPIFLRGEEAGRCDPQSRVELLQGGRPERGDYGIAVSRD